MGCRIIVYASRGSSEPWGVSKGTFLQFCPPAPSSFRPERGPSSQSNWAGFGKQIAYGWSTGRAFFTQANFPLSKCAWAGNCFAFMPSSLAKVIGIVMRGAGFFAFERIFAIGPEVSGPFMGENVQRGQHIHAPVLFLLCDGPGPQ